MGRMDRNLRKQLNKTLGELEREIRRRDEIDAKGLKGDKRPGD